MKGFELSAEEAAAHNAKVAQWKKNTLPVKSADVFKRGNSAEDSQGFADKGKTTLTMAQVREVPVMPLSGKPERKPKYGNKKITVDGILFDSVKEANRWLQLKAMQTRAEISELRRQVVFVLAPAVILDGRKKKQLTYVSDFTYLENGKQVVEDTKSSMTARLPVYRIKKHLLKHVFNLDILES